MGRNLLIKGGVLIDPSSGYDGAAKDILVRDGRIAAIKDEISPEEGIPVLALKGQYVAPGFIDINTHVYTGVSLGVEADRIGVKTGVTTVVDAGSAGPEDFEDFLKRDIRTNRTRVYSAMPYARTSRLHPPEADQEEKCNLDLTADAYQQYKDYIVAIKAQAGKSCTGMLGIGSVMAAKELAVKLTLPLLVDIGNMPPLIGDVLGLMEQGDIITHAFQDKANNLFESGKPKPETIAARKRGVLFDVGHGKESFSFETARQAKANGFAPDLVSSGLHTQNVDGPVYSLCVTLDKMLALGYSLSWCVEAVTSRPARYLKLEGLGRIACRYKADFTIFELMEGKYEYQDSVGGLLTGTRSINACYAVIDGNIEMDKASQHKTAARLSALLRVKSELDVTPVEFDHYASDMEEVFAVLDYRGIDFPEDNLLAFVNHMMTLLHRFKTGEKVPEMGTEVLNQLLPEAVAATRAFMNMIEQKYGPVDISEVILAAIHIHTAMEITEEKNSVAEYNSIAEDE